MHEVYILKSKVARKYYVGHTANIAQRLRAHNVDKAKATKAFRPWEVIRTEAFPDKSNAFRRERQIKSYKGGDAFRKILEKGRDPEPRAKKEAWPSGRWRRS